MKNSKSDKIANSLKTNNIPVGFHYLGLGPILGLNLTKSECRRVLSLSENPTGLVIKNSSLTPLSGFVGFSIYSKTRRKACLSGLSGFPLGTRQTDAFPTAIAEGYEICAAERGAD